MATRIGNLLTPIKKGRSKGNDRQGGTSSSDNVTHFSGDGEKSVARTVDSQLTVKASNKKSKTRHMKKPAQPPNAKGGWKTFKRLVVGGSTNKGDNRSSEFYLERSVKSTGSLLKGKFSRERVLSEDKARAKNSSQESSGMSARIRNQLDLAIKGRHDGVDSLSLGQVRFSGSSPRKPQHEFGEKETTKQSDSKSVNFAFDPLQVSFTGLASCQNPIQVVLSTIRCASGKEHSELMLEGYIPGGDDRWNVVLSNSYIDENLIWERSRAALVAKRPNINRNFSVDTDDDTAELTDDGSTNMPSHKLWDQMWGETSPPPTPPHMQRAPSIEQEEDDIMQLAASCSVPVDLDEDAFIIDGPEHFNSIRDLVMLPIQRNKFDTALSIFQRMLTGLKERSEPRLEHVQACTHHNMGILYMCQSKFEEAEKSFKEAVELRTQCLPQNHPDVAVSLMRQGEAAFALKKYGDALKSIRFAIEMSPAEDATRAKMLNNVGVVHYHGCDYSEALRAFTEALEIQRQWLDGPVRRESIVYDASITLGNMGRVFIQMKQLEVAHSMFEEACLLQMSAFHKDHELVLNSLENMAVTLAKNEIYAKASPILRGVLRSQDAKYGVHHVRSIETAGLLAFVLLKEMELEESVSLLKRVYKWQNENLSIDTKKRDSMKETISMVESLISGKTSLWV